MQQILFEIAFFEHDNGASLVADSRRPDRVAWAVGVSVPETILPIRPKYRPHRQLKSSRKRRDDGLP